MRRKASWRSGRDGGMAASRAAAVTADGAGAREVSGWRGAESIDAPATGIESRRRFAAGASRWASDPTTTGVSSRVSATGGFVGVEAGEGFLKKKEVIGRSALVEPGVPPPPGLSRFIAEAPDEGMSREGAPRRSADASSRSKIQNRDVDSVVAGARRRDSQG